MNDVSEHVRAKPAIVRPRDAASLIVLRGEGHDLELLAGRRPGHVRFMPGVWVFPGGAIDPDDRRPWRVETGGDTSAAAPRAERPRRLARDLGGGRGAGRPPRSGGSPCPPATPRLTPIEAAYAERGITRGVRCR